MHRNLPPDWCKRQFTERPSFDFAGLQEASGLLQSILEQKGKIQIVVDSDLDGICSATVAYKFLRKFYPEIECTYSLHTGKQHGLSNDIVIDNDTKLVLLPDSGVNDVERCHALFDKGIGVICLDHHIIEQPNPYASIVSCMDGGYPNQDLCGAAVTWLFFYGFSFNCIELFGEASRYLLQMLDLVATATISDIMTVTNDDNMYFIQSGLANIVSNALKAFLEPQEVNLNDVTIEHIRYKVSPFVSAMIRMGTTEEKTLLFRAFIDDYEEFPYEKRGSLGVESENIYDRVYRLCKNAKSRQDRAKQKLLDECKIHEYPHILLVEYQANKPSTLTGLVANELANQYCKPCIVYRQSNSYLSQNGGGIEYSGSIRNYDGSPITSFKNVLEFAFGDRCNVQGHDNAAGFLFDNLLPDEFEKQFSKALFSSYWDTVEDVSATAIGEREYNVDFEIDAEDVDAGFVRQMSFFDHYSGYGFNPVTVLVHNIEVYPEHFKTMGKNSLSWKISGDGVDYVKFKVNREEDPLIQKTDDIDWDSENYTGVYYLVDAICTFGLNVYKGVVYPQAIVKDYEITEVKVKKMFNDEDFDLDLDLGI